MADADALRYLRIAKADLLEARRMLDLSGFRDSSIGFLLQQACEKSFKSWSHSSGGMALFTHDLVALMDWLQQAEPTPVTLPALPISASLRFSAAMTTVWRSNRPIGHPSSKLLRRCWPRQRDS